MKKVLITAHQSATLPVWETISGVRYQKEMREFNSEISLEIQIPDNAEFNKVAGTALNRLFDWINLQKKHNIKNGLRLSLPLDLRFEVLHEDNRHTSAIFDTANNADLSPQAASTLEKVRQKMKVGSNAKAKRSFAGVFMGLFKFVTSEVPIVDIEEIFADLDRQIAAEGEDKAYQKWLATNADTCAN